MSEYSSVTVGDVLDRVRGSQRLNPRQRTDHASASRSIFVRVFDIDVRDEELLRATPLGDLDVLDSRLTALAACGDRTTRAYVSRTRAAVRLAGVPLPNGRGEAILSPVWRERLGALTAKQPAILRQLAVWASGEGLDTLDTPAMKRFAASMLAGKKGYARKAALQRLRDIYNIWVEAAPVFGQSIPENPAPYAERDWYAFDVGAFGAGFQVALDRYDARLRLRKRKLADETIKVKVGNIVRLASAACRSLAIEPDELSDPEQLFTGEFPVAAIRWMALRNASPEEIEDGLIKTHGSYDCALDLVEFARLELGEGDTRVKALRAYAKNMSPEPWVSLSQRSEAKLSYLTDPQAQRELLGLAHRVYRSLDPETATQDGLTSLAFACALRLILRFGLSPLEIVSLTTSDITLVGEGKIKVIVPERRRSSRRVVELDGPVADLVATYIERVRPRRPGASGLALFPNRDGEPISTTTLNRQVTAVTRRYGKPVAADIDHGRPISADIAHAAVALIVSMTDGGGDHLARELLGRVTADVGRDALFETIRGWKVSDTINNIEASHLNSLECRP